MGNDYQKQANIFNESLEILPKNLDASTDDTNIFFNEHIACSLLNDLKSLAGGYSLFESGKDIWSFQGVDSKVMDEYTEKYEQLQEIMSNYLDLMVKDIDAISKIGEEIKNVDNKLKGIW